MCAYSVFTLLLYIAAAGCSAENDIDYGIAWPSTQIDTNATNNCPDGAGITF